ncbi:MAG: cysteine hydrolase [Clostridia bacterium]|nr:cysteine hydrolase [Clostridia bacterium]
MRLVNKEEFIKDSTKTLTEIYDMLEQLPVLNLQDFMGKQTALVIVDMINGFAREGALMSPRVEALIPGITVLSKACDMQGIAKVAFADSHTSLSPEFEAYPEHCLYGTSESEVVREIKDAGGYDLIPKNSTNGFLEVEFQEWLEDHPSMDTFIVTGDCTDICIQQFAITLKTWFNRGNRKARVIVPMSLVDTYDLGVHQADLMNVMALYNMLGNGVEIVKEIKVKE